MSCADPVRILCVDPVRRPCVRILRGFRVETLCANPVCPDAVRRPCVRIPCECCARIPCEGRVYRSRAKSVCACGFRAGAVRELTVRRLSMKDPVFLVGFAIESNLLKGFCTMKFKAKGVSTLHQQ